MLRDERLADILADTAARRPDHPAVICGREHLTYRQLDAASRVVAGNLAACGARPGQVVGLFLPRGADALIAQAGITRSGAAWLPFDAEAPIERVAGCLVSAGALGVVSCRAWLPRLSPLPVPVWAIEDLRLGHPDASAAEAAGACPASPDDPAYVIYTSGSTGAPKGIAISHRSICHLLRSENTVLGVTDADRVYQGFSLAFDMSLEEIWISYLVGATVWIAPADLVADPDRLPAVWARERISVVHAVPTVMGLIDDPLPTLRIINLGGEACPEALVDRLARPGRRLFNSYGPTEATVTATIDELRPGAPVTIGAPLPNFGLLVVDEARRPAAIGEAGELCVFGPGLAIGYVGRPDLTAARFVDNPAAGGPAESRMYLTGDLARIDEDGRIRWLGRTDSQVKIRGYRIELAEIAATLGEQAGVAAAAAVVRRVEGVDQIVAFAAPRPHEALDPVALRRSLAARLPAYMMPGHIEVVADLPRLVSGKIDYQALRTIPLAAGGTAAACVEPRTEDEQALYSALGALLPGAVLRPEADFFFDLGGHSLLAARLVSALRADGRYASLGVQDVYRARRLEDIARAMARVRRAPAAAAVRGAAVPPRRRVLCGIAQALAAPFFVLLHMADWLAPFFAYHYFTGSEGDSIGRAVAWSLAAFVAARLTAFGVAIAGKRLTGRLRTGRFPLWGFTYFRWWLATRFAELPDLALIASTRWMPLYLRALGARIGREVIIDAVTVAAPELLTVEDGATLHKLVNIENVRVEGGLLVIGPVHLGRDCTVDSYAVLEDHTSIGRRARLCGLSALASGQAVPDDAVWDGAPARPADVQQDPLPPRPRVSTPRAAALALLSGSIAIAISVLFFLPTFPAFMLIDWLDQHTWNVFDSTIGPLGTFGLFFLLAMPASLLLVGITMLLTAGLRWVLPRQAAGVWSVHSLAFWRQRTISLILDLSVRVLHGLYASVFTPLWLRGLGVRVGRRAEISTAEGMIPELLSIGDESFVGDAAMLGDEEVRGGWMTLKPTRLGNRTFVGNGAYVPDGADLPDEVLVGVQTKAPLGGRVAPGQTWIGSPPVLLPSRERVAGFPDALTFRPSLARQSARGLVEALRIVLPLSVIIASGYLIVRLVMPLAAHEWGLEAAAALAAAGCAYGVGSFLLVAALKWVLIGRYRPRAAPMWTLFVWLSEAVTNLYETLAVPNLLDPLRGTPLLPWALRLLGVRIGRGVYLNTTDFTEFDCVRIGDGAELNAWSGPQTHLFEDRVMKIGLVDIGARAVVGARTTILYGAEVGEGAELGPLTLVAKGERVPPFTRWEGSPAAPGRTRPAGQAEASCSMAPEGELPRAVGE